MVIQKKDLIKNIRPNMRGGNGQVVLNSVEPDEMLPPHTRLFSEIVLEPGCSIGDHVHNGESEMFFYTEGETTLNDNGQKKICRPGDVSICHDGETHGITNEGSVTSKLIAVIVTK
jgi:mannose-6-phosphate isomerase-like protein (cupin superfamily)